MVVLRIAFERWVDASAERDLADVMGECMDGLAAARPSPERLIALVARGQRSGLGGHEGDAGATAIGRSGRVVVRPGTGRANVMITAATRFTPRARRTGRCSCRWHRGPSP